MCQLILGAMPVGTGLALIPAVCRQAAGKSDRDDGGEPTRVPVGAMGGERVELRESKLEQAERALAGNQDSAPREVVIALR